jgi:hypothetical protein
MTRSSPADIITYLDTYWVVGTISKPTFVNQFENEFVKDSHYIGVNWSSIVWQPEARVLDTEYNTLSIQIVEDSVANLIIVIDMVRDLLRVKTLAGGHYMITNGNPIKTGGYYQCFLTLEEVMYTQ